MKESTAPKLILLEDYNPSISLERQMVRLNDIFCEMENEKKECLFKNRVKSLIYHLIHIIEIASNAGMSKEKMREVMSDIWRIHSYSSFICHLQEWPKGYPGDFEAINMLVDRVEMADSDSLEGIIGRLAINSPIAQQHREKLTIQAHNIKKVCFEKKNARILSIACGSSRDIESIQEVVMLTGAHVTLVDFDQEAIDDSCHRLKMLGGNLSTIVTNVKRLPRLCEELARNNGKFDIAYAGGLFDYLPEGIILRLLKKITGDFMNDEGVFLFTNIAEGNPYKAWIETMANWKLIERSEEDIRKWVNYIRHEVSGYSLSLDPTGLTWIAKVIK